MDPTERRLVAAAERLFAEHGVGAVSLRAIMQAAGTNVAAVHYHFGSKEALLAAVLRSRVEQVSRERDALLAGAEPTVRALATAYVRPIVAVRESGGESWIRLAGRLLATGDDALAPIAGTFAERNAVFLGELARLTPGADPATLRFRLAQAMNVTLSVLGTGGDEQVVGRLIDVVTAILAGPPEEGEQWAPTSVPRSK